jgi:Flp pilus assembly protein TadG
MHGITSARAQSTAIPGRIVHAKKPIPQPIIYTQKLQRYPKGRNTPNTHMRASNDGQALVEFTLILALFLLVVFSIIEFAFIIYNKVTITDAAREGARTGAMYRANENGTPWTKEQIETFAKEAAINSLQGRLFTFGTPNLKVEANWNGLPPSQGGTNGKMEVVVNYDYSFIVLPRLSGSADGTLRLSSKAIMRTE